MTWPHPKIPFPQRVRLLFGSLSPSKFGDQISSFADPGCLARILDPGSKFFPSRIPDLGSKFFHPGSLVWIFSIPDPGSRMRIKEFKYFNQKKWFLSSQKYEFSILDLDHGSGSWLFTYPGSQSWIPILDPRSRIQRSKRHRIPDSGSRIRICNTGNFGFAQAVGGSSGYWLSIGAAVLTTHSMDQLSEAFMCKKEFSVYFIFTLSL